MIDKLKFYTRNESARKRVADGGYQRCKQGGYAYICRLNRLLQTIKITERSPASFMPQ